MVKCASFSESFAEGSAVSAAGATRLLSDGPPVRVASSADRGPVAVCRCVELGAWRRRCAVLLMVHAPRARPRAEKRSGPGNAGRLMPWASASLNASGSCRARASRACPGGASWLLQARGASPNRWRDQAHAWMTPPPRSTCRSREGDRLARGREAPSLLRPTRADEVVPGFVEVRWRSPARWPACVVGVGRPPSQPTTEGDHR